MVKNENLLVLKHLEKQIDVPEDLKNNIILKFGGKFE